jgi:two-component system response regulator FlrC
VANEAQPTAVIDSGALSAAVKSSEYQAIMTAIKSSSNRSEAAKKLGISPRSLRYKMAQFRERGLPTLAAG